MSRSVYPYQHIFRALTEPALLLKPDPDRFEIIDANDAYCEVTNSERDHLSGIGLFEAFPENPSVNESNGTQNLETSLLKVIETGKPHYLNRQRYDIPIRGTDKFEERYWNPVNTPVFDENGTMICIIHSVQDVSNEVFADMRAKHTGVELRKSESRLEEAQKIARIGNWDLDLVHNKLYWSEMTREIHEVEPGYEPDLETAIEFYKEGVHRENIAEVVNHAIETGEPFDLELIIVTAKGNERWVRATGVAEMENNHCMRIYGVIQDIDQRKQMLYSLRERVKEQVCLYRILKLNESEKEISELLKKAVDIIPDGWQYPEITGAEITWNNLQAATSAMPEGAAHIETEREIGEVKLLKVRVWYSKAMSDEYEGPFLKEEVDLLNSIADNIMIHIRQIESRIQLEKRTEELIRSNRELEQFAFATSHDLQEPLRMINSFLTQLERKYGELLDERANTYIRFAKQGAERMRNVILNLLEYSRVEAENDPETIDLNHLVSDVTHDLRKRIEETGVKLEIPKLPVIKCIRVPLRHLFYNLLKNSLIHAASADKLKVEICLKESDTDYKIGVRDNGPGIDSEYHQKIFELFQRLGSYDESSTGIGLAICKKSAEHLGGTIWVESEPGKDSTFWFTLPKQTT